MDVSLRNLKDKLLQRIYEQPQSLIAVLLDRSVDYAERDDAATYLIPYDEPEAEKALLSIASDLTEDDDIAESCGECVAEIWCRNNILSLDKLRNLKPAAFEQAIGIIGVQRPEWMPRLQKEKLISLSKVAPKKALNVSAKQQFS